MRSVINLNGVWKFAFQEHGEPACPFVTTEVATVPGCFDLCEPRCGRRGYATYVRTVTAGGRVKLSIDGLGLEGKILWDGQVVGKVRFAYLPIDIVFDAGESGEHELCILVTNRFTPRFDPCFDFYGYGGIYGDVTLESLPEPYVESVHVMTEDYRTGTVRIQASVSHHYDGQATLVIDNLWRGQGTVQGGRLDLCVQVPGFRLWTPETPNCHELTFMIDGDQLRQTFGIRQIETRGRQLLLNGRSLKLIGVNRHESHPSCGAAMPPQLMEQDLRLLKSHGFNFIRGSHYAQRRQLLELCDRMGIIVWEETLGWDIRPPKLHDPSFLADQLEQAELLTRSHLSHPSILFRGFLNENSSECEETRPVIQAIAAKIREIDPHSLITYASNRYEKDICCDLVDVVSMNPYPGWYDANYEELSTCGRIPQVLQALSDKMPQDKPLLITEIGAEALYGFRDPIRTYWSEDYQAELLENAVAFVLEHEDCAGIAIWQFADTRSYVNGPGIYGRARGFNNKGMLDEYRRPKLSWIRLVDYLARHQLQPTQ